MSPTPDGVNFPDPRPRTRTSRAGESRVAGQRCAVCSFPVALAAPWCPKCRGALVPTEFGPEGVVWASTVVRVALPGRTPPYALTYVDLDEGPRVLGHLKSATAARVPAGQRVRLLGESPDGDLAFELV